MRILIVEDDLVSRKFLHKFLSRYGECDLVIDALETLDTFLLALKDNEPYHLICLDIMMPKVDGVNTLKVIRDLERQYGIAPENRVKIIMMMALAEPQFVQTAFDYGCEAYAVKPIDTKKLKEVLEKLRLMENDSGVDSEKEPRKANFGEVDKNTTKRSMWKKDLPSTMIYEANKKGEGYFRSVQALPGYQLEVVMETSSIIQFDFRTRLNTARFGMLRDEELFQSVQTDGNYLIFYKAGRMPVKITASEFMDLVLIDRRK
jgi:two-component system chemotaxis response regulator CheY